MIEQLRTDVVSENPSLAAKWVPREKSQFGHLFNELAVEYFDYYIKTAKTMIQQGSQKPTYIS
jgi:excinuclease UvrABC helicase subunit UvrB